MNDWADIMGRRDRVAALLRPHMGKGPARERANDIVQALLCADERADELALRILARDLEPPAAEVVAFQVGKAWTAPGATGSASVSTEGAAGDGAQTRGTTSQKVHAFAESVQRVVRFKRPRRETVLLKESPETARRLSSLWT